MNSVESTPKKRRCNCKQSKCLKLYCECFASGIYCDGCNCSECYNNKEHEAIRQEAVEATLERNPDAFRPKIANTPGLSNGSIDAKHNKGCNCKRSFCLKRYCECFQAGIYCSENCRCIDCKNFEGSHARMLAMGQLSGGVTQTPPGKRQKNTPASEKANNANQAGGTRSKLSQQHQQQSVAARGDAPGLTSPPKFLPVGVQQPFAPRSILAGIVNENVVKHLSTLLMMVAQDKEDQRGGVASPTGGANPASKPPSNDKAGENDASNANGGARNAGPNHAPGGKAEASTATTGSADHLQTALLCDDEDGMLDLDSPKTRAVGHKTSGDKTKLEPIPNLSSLYSEQERAVLSEFNNCLSVINQLGRQRAEYVRLLLSSIVPPHATPQAPPDNNNM